MSRNRAATAARPPKASSENVKVVVRMRPMNRLELRTGQKIAWNANESSVKQLVVKDKRYNPSKGRGKAKKAAQYDFDQVILPTQTNDFVFASIGRPLVEATVRGYHTCMFAYGQTSSGKTFTIHGSSKHPGMIPLCVEEIFSLIEETPEREFVLRVAYLEIYQERIADLLNPSNTNLRVRESRRKGVFVEGLKEDVVMSADQVFSLLSAGTSHRHIGRTNYNDVSSRSHTIFRIIVESQARSGNGPVRVSHLNLIDLAGSENAVKAGSAARRAETGFINKSLLTLGSVIFALSEGGKKHVPFRDSKLTRVLQNGLSGKAKVTMCCTISPSSDNVEESISTLKFAARAKKVVNQASINERMDDSALLNQYRQEIEKLRTELEEARSRAEVMASQAVSEEQLQEKEEEKRRILMQSQEEKADLQAKIDQLTRLILKSSRPVEKKTPEPSAPAAASKLGGKKKGVVRVPPQFKHKRIRTFGTLPRNFAPSMLAAASEAMASGEEIAGVGTIKRRGSLRRLNLIADLDEEDEDDDNDQLCPTPAPETVMNSSMISDDDVQVNLSDLNLSEESVESMGKRLMVTRAKLAATRQELEVTREQVKTLEEKIEEQEDLLKEWDNFYVTTCNKQAAVQNELRKVARKGRDTAQAPVPELADLMDVMGLGDEFDSPLVELDQPVGQPTKPGSTAEEGAKKVDTARFSALMNRFKSMEQDLNEDLNED